MIRRSVSHLYTPIPSWHILYTSFEILKITWRKRDEHLSNIFPILPYKFASQQVGGGSYTSKLICTTSLTCFGYTEYPVQGQRSLLGLAARSAKATYQEAKKYTQFKIRRSTHVFYILSAWVLIYACGKRASAKSHCPFIHLKMSTDVIGELCESFEPLATLATAPRDPFLHFEMWGRFVDRYLTPLALCLLWRVTGANLSRPHFPQPLSRFRCHRTNVGSRTKQCPNPTNTFYNHPPPQKKLKIHHLSI